MADTPQARTRIDQRLPGEPHEVYGRHVQPVARLTGWVGGNSGPAGGGAGGWLRLRPVEVVVREADGSEHTIPMADPNALVVRGLAAPGLAVAAVCGALMLVAALRKRSA